MKRFFLVAVLLFTVSSQSHAATLATPAIVAGNLETLRCVVNNVGTRGVFVERLEVVDPDATPRLLREDRELLPNGSLTASVGAGSLGFSGLNPWFCRAVIRGGTKSVRLTLCSALQDLPACTSSVTTP